MEPRKASPCSARPTWCSWARVTASQPAAIMARVMWAYQARQVRTYDWTAIALDPAGLLDGWGHWLLVRQQTEPGEGAAAPERAYCCCAGPAAIPLRELIRVAGTSWAIEECFQTASSRCAP
jgi:hypothetical protein